MRKAVFVAASVLALLVVLYAAAGHWLAPRFVRSALVEQAQRRGLELRIEEVRTDPFALKLTLENVRVLTRDGTQIASAHSAAADLAWASLWRPTWIVQDAWVHQPRIEVVRGPGGELNWPVTSPQGKDTEAQVPLTVQQLVVSEGELRFVDTPFEVTLEALGLELKGLSTQGEQPAHYQLAARVGAGGSVSSQGRLSLNPLSARGELGAAAVPLSWLWEEARAQLHATAAYAYDGERLVLEDVSLEAARFAYAGIELPQVALRSPRMPLPPREPFEVSGSASASPRGTLSARGTMGVQPLSADLEISLNNLPLPQAQRWLPDGMALRIASGTVAANGRLLIQEDVKFDGAVAVRDARFEEPGSGTLLLAWQALETDEARLRLSPFAVEIGELAAKAPSGRLIIEEDGRINFAQVFQQENSGNDIRKQKAFDATVQRLRIENGTLDFADRSLDNDFAVTIRELSGGITGFSTEPGNPARVQLAGRVEKYGSAQIRGTINLDQPKSLTSIRATFRNLDLAELTPYAVKFAGYRIQSGRLSAELRYRVRDGRLVGQNELTFEELRLGEKVQGAGARELPLELAVALLADAEGRINLDIPVSGNLNDPQFDFGGLIARALGNVVGKIVSAPFRALAALLGESGMDLDSVRFEPGTTALTPPAEENVAQVAKALEARPQLGVTVQGSYDAERDLAALRLQTARRHIAQRAGYEGGGPLDFSDPKVLQAAEKLYLERVGNRLQMLELRNTEPRYARALVQKLAAALPVAPDTGETLARARAETVRAELLTHGVDPSRVRVEAPAVKQAGDEGVPTLLSLNTGGAASAGATAP